MGFRSKTRSNYETTGFSDRNRWGLSLLFVRPLNAQQAADAITKSGDFHQVDPNRCSLAASVLAERDR